MHGGNSKGSIGENLQQHNPGTNRCSSIAATVTAIATATTTDQQWAAAGTAARMAAATPAAFVSIGSCHEAINSVRAVGNDRRGRIESATATEAK